MPIFVMLLMAIAVAAGFHTFAYVNWVVSSVSAIIVVALVVFAIMALLSFAFNQVDDAREDY